VSQHKHEFKGKTGRCQCGFVDPYYELTPLLRHLVESARNFEVRQIPEHDEPPPEPERFSGGVNLSARARNAARLSYVIMPAARLILVGRYTLALLRSMRVVKPAAEANERFEVIERMKKLGLSTQGLR
jgi:hypothetical protein